MLDFKLIVLAIPISQFMIKFVKMAMLLVKQEAAGETNKRVVSHNAKSRLKFSARKFC